MLSQDLFSWGLSGEQSVAALLPPLADASGGTKPKSPSAGMGRGEPLTNQAGMGWGESLIDQAGMGVLWDLPDVCVSVAPEQDLERGSWGGGPRAFGVARVSLFTLS